MPFRSKAQARAAFGGHIPGFSKKRAGQWAQETLDFAALPEYVHRNASRCSDDYIDNKDGAGATPNNGNVDYLGLRVRMTPRVFHALAFLLPRSQALSANALAEHMQNGGKVASPMLYIEIPEGWEDNDFSYPALVKGHEGRNRMYAFSDLCGSDEDVEVHIFPLGGYRARHLKPWAEALQRGMLSQDGSKLVLAPNRSSRKKFPKNRRCTSRKRSRTCYTGQAMKDKHKIWSEGRGERSTATDVLEGLDFEQLDNVREEVTRSGVLYTGNCMKCGRQWKMVTKWVELASWFVGQPVPETTPTRQGVLTQPRCPACGSEQRFVVQWHEIKNHVDAGVRSGMLPQTIYAATVFGAR